MPLVSGGEYFLPLHPISLDQAEKLAAPHAASMDLAAYHSRMGLVACVDLKKGEIHYSVPEDRLQWDLQNGSLPPSSIYWGTRCVRFARYTVVLKWKMEKDGTIGVYFNNSPGEFLSSSNLQAHDGTKLAEAIIKAISPSGNFPNTMVALIAEYSGVLPRLTNSALLTQVIRDKSGNELELAY
ncbi:MAG TPA: hypothetical protein VGM34_02975 [Chlamydiales bacterium]|jgi:hypothetical protein